MGTYSTAFVLKNTRNWASKGLFESTNMLSRKQGNYFQKKKTSKSTCTTISLQCTEQVPSHTKVKVKSLSRVRLFVTLWTVARQAPLSTGFSRQEYWSGLPFPSPGDLPDPGIKPGSPALEANALTSEPPRKPAQSHRKHQFWWRRKRVYLRQVSHIFPWC